jgi:hypothetical protein
LQLGPCSHTTPKDARTFTIPVEADDILILATDGLSDNLWDEEILDEVVRFRRSFLQNRERNLVSDKHTMLPSLLGRKALAGMLSEALCSRARAVIERGRAHRKCATGQFAKEEPESPFAMRAREHGHVFRGGKADGEPDILFSYLHGLMSILQIFPLLLL